MDLHFRSPRRLFITKEALSDTTQVSLLLCFKVDRTSNLYALIILTPLGPVSRFGDTAANVGILALLHSNSYLNRMPTLIQTVFASLW